MESCGPTAIPLSSGEYPFHVYPPVTEGLCSSDIYGSDVGVLNTTPVWEHTLPHVSPNHLDNILGHVPSYELQQPAFFQPQQLSHPQYTAPATSCSTPLSVASTGSTPSDLDLIFSPSAPIDANTEPLPLQFPVFSDEHSPTTATRTSAPHRTPGKQPKVRGRCYAGRRRAAPIYPEKSVPISRVKETRHDNNFSQQSDVMAPSATLEPGAVTDLAADFIHLRRVLHSAASEATRVPIRVELSCTFRKQFEDIENELLRLQAEKAKLMKIAHETSKMSAPSPRQSAESVMVNLSLCRTGFPEIDIPQLEAANHLLSAIGGLHYELTSAIKKLFSSCAEQGQDAHTCDVSDTISRRISTLQCLHHEPLKLFHCTSTGVFQISSPSEDTVEDVTVLNDLLKYAQFITLSNNSVQEHLETLLAVSKQSVSQCVSGSSDQVRAILEWNYVTMTVAERVWQEQHQMATDTITTITECLQLN